MAERRDALKIIGAIGSTCAFPFSADELYGQHAHGSGAAEAALPNKPVYFREDEMRTVSALAELIIPATDTPGAIAAGVPQYIDYVVSSNAQWKELFRDGLAWLDAQAKAAHGKRFHEVDVDKQTVLVKGPIADADQYKTAIRGRRSSEAAPMEVQFLKAFKSMTADGYFTSKIGLVDTLKYAGNSVLGEFPQCIHEH